MSTEERSYVGDVGTIVKIDMQETITGATGLIFNVRKPNGDEVVWTPSIDGTEKLKYTVVEGDFNVPGVYKIQPELTLGTFSGKGYTARFTVYRKYT